MKFIVTNALLKRLGKKHCNSQILDNEKNFGANGIKNHCKTKQSNHIALFPFWKERIYLSNFYQPVFLV